MSEQLERSAPLGIDGEALRRKYLEERDRRIKSKSPRQYTYFEGEFARYAGDPYVEPGFTREPMNDETDVLVLGGGMTGLMVAAALVREGVDDFRIVENGGDFGGTWYWNRYPGIRCDIESYIYIPFVEQLNFMPTEKYSRGREILAHCQAIGRHFGLYDRAVFQTQVTAVDWDEDSARWIVETDRGDRFRSRFLITGTGVLSRPKLPNIPGIERFKGHSFHTSRWDYDYTGGDETGGLTGLADKRVAIIGTGATAIQIVPYLAQAAKRLCVFQRTPSSIDVRNNHPTDPDWAATLKPGWQKRRRENFVRVMLGMTPDPSEVGDRWTDVSEQVVAWTNSPPPDIPATDPGTLAQYADYKKMDEIRARVDDIVKDPETARALKPWYNLWCKRPGFSDEYLQAFNHPNVTLIDTRGRGVDAITETGLLFDGQAYEVDCIIYASGFDLGVPTYEAGGYKLRGRQGRELADKWKDGVKSLHGTYTAGFPNLIIIGNIIQASVTTNFPHILEEQADHAAAFIRRCLAEGISTFDVRPEAETAWEAELASKRVDRSQFEGECSPGVFNNEGRPEEAMSMAVGSYGAGPFEFLRICKEFREGDLAELELTR